MKSSAFAIAAAAALTLGSPAYADEPAAADPRPAAEAPRAPALLAAASKVEVPTPQTAAASPAPVKKRAARVTTCRCGEGPKTGEASPR